jgi:glycosyltransferase involved in cell wall biosynthesis
VPDEWGIGVDLPVVLWVAFGIALVFIGFMLVARARYLSLPKLTAASGRGATDCMVIIPARNEEGFIARAVNSLPHDTVIVVDDHSEDQTAEVARKSGAGVMHAPDLVKAAIGKANACLAGARVLTSKWILFADADTWFDPGFLDAAVACAEASGLAFLSFYPRLEFGTAGESILAPFAQALFFCGVSPKQDPTSVFNGQCVLVRRDAYEFIGSHGAVMNTMVDDVKLAALARRHRLNLGTARADHLAHVRLRDPFDSFHRGAFRFMALNSWMGVMVVIAATFAALWGPVLAWLLWDGERIAGIIFGLMPVIGTMPWYRNPLRALAVPLAIYGMLPIVWGGMLAALNGSTVEWKGREI